MLIVARLKNDNGLDPEVLGKWIHDRMNVEVELEKRPGWTFVTVPGTVQGGRLGSIYAYVEAFQDGWIARDTYKGKKHGSKRKHR